MAFFFFLCSFLWIGGNHVKGQSSTEGFISIDCGITSQSSYTDKLTNIQYVSDSQFIDTGINYKIASNYMIDGLSYQGQTVRSFPLSVRNCYTLSNATDGNKYLIRASFFYGNYDGSQTVKPGNPLLFDLYLGGNFWKTVNISDDSMEYSFEIATVAVGRHISICLINTGFGTPFISTLEMRPLGSLYPEARPNQSIAFLLRYNYGPKTNQITRYPDDQYDRLWSTYTFNSSTWNEISTTSPITFYSNDSFLPPIAVLQTAVTPLNSTKLISFFKWSPEIGNRSNIEYRFIFHFSELMKNVSRSFTVFCGGNAIGRPFYPQYLKHGFVNGSVAQVSFTCTLYPYANNGFFPFINALELYQIVNHTSPTTNTQDIDAMLEIKAEYGLKKNWMGDPCLPSQFAWSGLNCSYDNGTASIKFINLSYSGLTGGISNTFSKLQAVTFLDLSNNNLAGKIPDSLADMQLLQVLNLTGNCLRGQVPLNLQQKTKNGSLILLIGNSSCTNNGSSNGKTIAIAASIASLFVVVVVIFVVWARTRNRKDPGRTIRSQEKTLPGIDFHELTEFTQPQLQIVTNNFSQVIGKGGFGKVYHGVLEDGTEVAVKVASKETSTVLKQFFAEANLFGRGRSLLQVQHQNLVSLVGYCRDPNCLALIYEYMSEGSLHDNLRGKANNTQVLNWGKRLRIAVEAAQGLDYLHRERKIIHRDIKSSNILIGKNFQAKIADFGLSKMFESNDSMTSYSICGTPGYIDPEACRSPLNEKSDVYSFGIVLLEIVTGEPHTLQGREFVHIIDHVKHGIAEENIDQIVDCKLREEYDYCKSSIKMVIDIAMRCTKESSARRPTMAEVATQLHEILKQNYVFRVSSDTRQTSSSSAARDLSKISALSSTK